MRPLITGATGFIGAALAKVLRGPVVLTRDVERARVRLGRDAIPLVWKPTAGPPPPEAFAGIDTVFHLAGEPIAGGRWDDARKQRLYDSRVLGTRHLVERLAALSERPRVLVSASATGYYGSRGDEVLEETAAPGSGLLAELCRDWEAEAARAADLGLRVVIVRIGVVLGREGGALRRMLPPFRLGLGGRLGSGRQWMPWIHRDDLVELLTFVAENESVAGPVNAVAPHPVTNRQFTRTLAAALRRPALCPLPAFVLRLLLGELASVLLSSQRAVPAAARAAGYEFHFSQLGQGLAAALGQRRRALWNEAGG